MRKLLVALGGLFLCLSAQAQNGAVGLLTAAGADCTTAGACVTLQFDINDVASASIQLSGTFTATVQFEASSDKGTTWVAISGTPLNSSTAVTSATTANTWKFNVASLTNIRARASAWTSSPTAIIRSSRAVANAIGGGGAVFASGGTTNNVIPKSNGSSQLADSALTDNATNVISTEAIVAPTSNAACMLCISGNITSGIAQDFSGSGPRMWGIAAGVRRGWVLDANSQLITLSSAGVYTFNSSATDPGGTSADTGLSRGGATGIVDVGTGAQASTAGTINLATIQYRGLAQTYFVTSDFTTSGSGTALEAITGLTWTFPATTAINARVDCNILYNQNVANVAVAFGFQDATVAPTNLSASGTQYTSATASTEGTLAASTTTTATAVTSATPSAITTIWHAQLHFLIEQPSNASTSVFTIRVSTAAAADLVTVKRGSYCALAQ